MLIQPNLGGRGLANERFADGRAVAFTHDTRFLPFEAQWQFLRLQMTFIQATQGGGGWPMSVFLTPELQPFTGGTYFPPVDIQGRPSFTTVLKAVAKAWKLKKAAIRAQGADIIQQLAEATKPSGMHHSSPQWPDCWQ